MSCLYLSSRFTMVDKHWSLWRPEFITEGLSELGGRGGGADQLTLSQSGLTDYAQCITTPPPPIFRPSYSPVAYKYSTYVRYVSRISIRTYYHRRTKDIWFSISCLVILIIIKSKQIAYKALFSLQKSILIRHISTKVRAAKKNVLRRLQLEVYCY